MKRAAGGIIGLMVAAGLGLWSYTRDVSSEEGAASKNVEAPRPVQIAKAARLDGGTSVRLSAVTRPSSQTRISFSVGGRIKKIPMDVGERLHRGDAIAALDPASLRHAVQAGEASISELDIRLAQADKDSNRMAQLASQGAVTKAGEENARSSRDALTAAREAALVGLSEARRQLRESVLRAPYDCTVSAVLAEKGEVVGPGIPVAVLEGDGTFEVELEVPETLIGGVHEGDRVPVDLPLVGIHGIDGEVTAIARSAAGPGGLFPVTITLPTTPGVRGGLTAEIELVARVASGIGVPIAAVVNPSGEQASVMKVEQDRAVRVKVVTHELVGDRIAVSGALREGDEVIVAGHQQLLGGEAVEVVP